jgi:predicted DNA-binding transcriptional regulator AlpA
MRGEAGVLTMTKPSTALQEGRWPRLLNRAVAAEYCGVGIDTFNANVDRGALPRPLQLPTGAVLWDRAELDGAIDLLKTGRDPAEETIGNVREAYEAFKRERRRGAAKRRS